MTIISSDYENTSGPGYTFTANNDDLLIKQGVILASTDHSAVESSRTANTISNYGNLYSGSYAVYFSSGSYAPAVINHVGASIDGSYGINIYGSYGEIQNAGTIHGSTAGIAITGTYTHIGNTGEISGTIYGMFMSGGGQYVRNGGLITGGSYGLDASLSANSTLKFFNSGAVEGLSAAIVLDADLTGALALTNSGSVRGDLRLAGGDDVIRNTGTIVGDVLLGGGTNRFDGRDGTMTGEVTGGAGVDTIITGDDGETLDGGKGHDRLYAGGGADTFAISSFAAGDTDVIKRFDVAEDLFQLDHSVFTHLKADTVPTFAIGTKASSPTDFLFYNGVTGGLFYDVDGSGATVRRTCSRPSTRD